MDQTVAKGVGYLFLAHAGSRAITFLLNQALLRYLTPAGLGASVRYELFLTTILYFTRDNVRLASQRLDYGEQEAINMAYLSIPAGILLCYAIGTLSTGWPVRKPNWNVSSLLLYGCAAVIELLSEPAYAVIQQRQLLRVRALAEGIGSIFRGSVAFVFAYLLNRIGRELSAAPLAVAQIIYSICLFITYTWSVTHLPPGNFSLLLRRTSSRY